MHAMKTKNPLRIFCGILCVLLFLTAVVGCVKKDIPEPDSDLNPGTATAEPPVTDKISEPGIVPAWTDTSMNGMCFGITGAYSRKLDVAQLIDLLNVMNVKCMRNWMHITTCLSDPSTPKDTMVKRFKGWLEQLHEAGVTKIVGMSHYWFLPESVNVDGMDKNMARSAAPYPSDEADSVYRRWLDLYEQSWYTMASTFPEITFWEVGNEVNMDLYLHPLTYTSRGTTFTAAEKAEIVTDMLYYASRGIHRANPDAVVIFPGLAPVNGFESMSSFLEKVYRNIESGKFGNGATDTNCYFQAVAWHGYVLNKDFQIDEWVEGNNSVYAVMQKHGDGDKKVFLTEFGFSDGGNRSTDRQQAEYYEQIYARLADMPYLDSIYPFRLIEDTKNTDQTEVYYGIFRVFHEKWFGAKEKAKTICRLYGGDADALDKYIGDNAVYSN